MPEPARLRWHKDPEAFRDLLTLTAARAGFLVRLVEKDYFYSVLLQYLAASCPGLVFKGGTCLAKEKFRAKMSFIADGGCQP